MVLSATVDHMNDAYTTQTVTHTGQTVYSYYFTTYNMKYNLKQYGY